MHVSVLIFAERLLLDLCDMHSHFIMQFNVILTFNDENLDFCT